MKKIPDKIKELAPYVPGLSIEEIRNKYGLSQIIKMASNENPLGVSPLACEAIKKTAEKAFRYPASGNSRLCESLARYHKVDKRRIAAGNGSDEIIDILIRIFTEPAAQNIVCFKPCFSIYPIQAQIHGIEIRRQPLNEDLSQDMDALLRLADEKTGLVFITAPDNPSGYCPPPESVKKLAEQLKNVAPDALLLIDEAYIDFADEGCSLAENGIFPENAVFLRTFSKCYGLAGIRLGYAILPEKLSEYFWRARLPFSVNLLAEEAGLAALKDQAFRKKTIETVKKGKKFLTRALEELGCKVWPSQANFLLFRLPPKSIDTDECHMKLLERGIIIRGLKSYDMPDYLRVSIGNDYENSIFAEELKKILG